MIFISLFISFISGRLNGPFVSDSRLFSSPAICECVRSVLMGLFYETCSIELNEWSRLEMMSSEGCGAELMPPILLYYPMTSVILSFCKKKEVDVLLRIDFFFAIYELSAWLDRRLITGKVYYDNYYSCFSIVLGVKACMRVNEPFISSCWSSFSYESD